MEMTKESRLYSNKHALDSSYKNFKFKKFFEPMEIVSLKNINVTILLGNPREPVELGNPNTCAEVKLCYYFLCRLQK